MTQRKRRKSKPARQATRTRTRRLDGVTAAPKANLTFWHGTDVVAVVADINESLDTGYLTAGINGVGSDNSADEPPAVTAAIRSLGPPPLFGSETVAEHYFEAIYERAAAIAATLLATAEIKPVRLVSDNDTDVL